MEVKERRLKKPLRENPYLTFTQWQFPEDPEYRIIGKVVPPKDTDRITGKAPFSRDIKLPGMLYAKWLTSPYAHARVKKVDVSDVKSMPGVYDVLVCGDPDLQVEGSPEGLGVCEEYPWGQCNVKRPDIAFILPCEAVYEGQPVAVAVAAETPEKVDEALKMVKIEWEELPFVIDRDEALKPDAPIAQLFRGQDVNVVDPVAADLHSYVPWVAPGSDKCERGDVGKGLKEADRVIEFEIKVGTNCWGGGGVEPYASVAWIHNSYLDIWFRVQVPWMVPESAAGAPRGITLPIAASLAGVPLDKIHVHIPYTGAGFGGMNWVGNGALPTLLAVVLSKRTGRPVMVLADWSSFSGITEEEEGHYKFKVGFKNDGTVTAVEIWSNASRGHAGLAIPGCEKLFGITTIKNCRCESTVPYINKAPAACYKHGTTETIVLNEVFSQVAAALGKDPMEVALKNDGYFGHPMHPDMDEVKTKQGFPLRDSLKEVIEAGKKAMDWDNKWHPPGAKKLPNGKYHGLGFAWADEWRAGPWLPFASDNPYHAVLYFLEDGTATIKGMRTLIGVHEKTTYCQIVAEEAGLRYEDVELDHEFNEARLMFPAASGGLTWNSVILKELGMKAKRKLLEVASVHFNKRPEELDIKDSIIFERENPENKVTVRDIVSRYKAKFAGGVWATGETVLKGTEMPPTPREVHHWGRQAAFVEVEVDPDTGKVDVKKFVIVNDVGRVINPGSVAGQQYGGVYMGLGRAHTEEIIYDPLTGVKLNDSLTWYHVPTITDIPRLDAIAVETGLGYSAYGNMGVGEDPNCVARAVLRSAVYNAIGKWIDEDPITPFRVLKALGKG